MKAKSRNRQNVKDKRLIILSNMTPNFKATVQIKIAANVTQNYYLLNYKLKVTGMYRDYLQQYINFFFSVIIKIKKIVFFRRELEAILYT